MNRIMCLVSIWAVFQSVYAQRIEKTVEHAPRDRAVIAPAETDVRPVRGTDTGTDPDSIGIKVYDVYFWGINRSDGTLPSNPKYRPNGNPLNEVDVKNAVTILNHGFGPHGIYFNLKGFGHFNSDKYYMFHHREYRRMLSYADSIGAMSENAFNIYVPYILEGAGGKSSYHSTTSMTQINHIAEHTVVHELGHGFNLPHIWRCESKYRCRKDCEGEDAGAIPNFRREHQLQFYDALRDAGFKASEANTISRAEGFAEHDRYDEILTALEAADFNEWEIEHLKHDKFINFINYDEEDCRYTGEIRGWDCNGNPYDLPIETEQNFMNLLPDGCGNYFTAGQGERMRAAIALDRNGVFSAAESSGPCDIDLYMQNSPRDIGQEPDTRSRPAETLHDSGGIWVRHRADGFETEDHQDPRYMDEDTPVYAYVRVRNKSCADTRGTEKLSLYWSGTCSSNWPRGWESAATQVIPVIPAWGSAVLEFEWLPPNPEGRSTVQSPVNPRSLCLMARIETPDDPMPIPETGWPYENARNNNNIVLRRVSFSVE